VLDAGASGPDDPWKRHDVFVLGAGFSRAINVAMPITSGLRADLHSALGYLPPEDIEGWLSMLGSAQPFLDRSQNLANESKFLKAAVAIASAIESHQQESMATRPPRWLLQLCSVWYKRRCTLITFNYDTLVEWIAARLGLDRYFPMVVPLYKLHGSIHESWDSAVSGGDIRRAATVKLVGDRLPVPDWKAGGRYDPFLVPPVLSKHTFYNVPELRDRWLKAASAIRECESLSFWGYSMPNADYASAYLVSEALRDRDPLPDVYVSNLDPQQVVDRLTGLGLDVAGTFDGLSAIKEATEAFCDLEVADLAAGLKRDVARGSLEMGTMVSVQFTLVSTPPGIGSIDPNPEMSRRIASEISVSELLNRLESIDLVRDDSMGYTLAACSREDRHVTLLLAPDPQALWPDLG
jgi:hypothetical protein